MNCECEQCRGEDASIKCKFCGTKLCVDCYDDHLLEDEGCEFVRGIVQRFVAANRERDLWFKETNDDGEFTGNCIYVPHEWCDLFTFWGGMTGGPDWTPVNTDDAESPELYGYAPTHLCANSPVETLYVSIADLRNYPEITEAEARRLHPALSEHLDRIDAEGK